MKSPVKRTAISKIIEYEAYKEWVNLYSENWYSNKRPFFSDVLKKILKEKKRPHALKVVVQYVDNIRKSNRQYRNKGWFKYLS